MKALIPRKHSIAESFRRLMGVWNRSITVILVPHSERKTIHLRINVFVLSAVILCIFGLAFYLVYISVSYTQAERTIAVERETMEAAENSLSGVVSEVGDLLRVYQVFNRTLEQTLEELDINPSENPQEQRSGDFSSISDLQEITENSVTELYELRQLRESLSEIIVPIGEMSSVLESERLLLADIPTLWPVVGGPGTVSMEFGPSIHPILESWYIHRGIDIPGTLGLPVIASANGEIIEARYDTVLGYGNTIVIEHNLGFKTRYSHLGRILVREGDQVYQGQQIGTLGRTGLTTVSKLNFQIILGSEIVDPNQFLKIRNDFARWTDTYGTAP